MKVVHIATGSASVPPPKYDSTTKDIFYLTKALAELECDVSVVDIRADAQLRKGSRAHFREVFNPPLRDVGIYRHVIRIFTFALLCVPALRREVKEDRPDIVHTHSQFPSVAILLARRLFRWKIHLLHNTHNHVIVMETSTRNRMKHGLEIFALKHADSVMADTFSAKKRLHEVFGIPPEKVFVRPEGLDMGEIDAFIKAEPRRKTAKETMVVLYPALIIPRKNQLGLVRAAPEILKSHPHARFVLPGPVGDRAYYEMVRKEVAERKLTEQFEFTGELPRAPDLFRWYRNADVFVFPTFHEMQGATLLEAMAFGLPCAASDIGPVVDIAGADNSAVLLFNPGDPHAIAQAVIHLLADEGLRVRLSAAGQKVARNYSWESIARDMLRQYQQMLGVGGSGRQAR